MTNDALTKIGKMGKLDDWPLQVLDQSRLPDVEAIEARHVAKAFEEKSNLRLIGLGIGVVLGMLIGYIAAGALGLLAGVGLGAIGFGIAHLYVKSLGIKEAQRELMPDIAKQCGGDWHEHMEAHVPEGNPASRWGVSGHDSQRAHEQFENMTNDLTERMGAAGSVARFALRNAEPSYREIYHDGIVGRLPGHDLAYGIFNFETITKTQTTDSEGKPDTDTDHDHYVIGWLDLTMPFEALELKKRWAKGGGALGRMADRLDTKVSSQKVLDMESEAFNRAFKVELPDGADEILVRRVFSPKIMDALVHGSIAVPENVIFRNGRIWIVDQKLGTFNGRSAAKTLDYMIYRAQLAATTCRTLAAEVGHDIAPTAYSAPQPPQREAYTPPQPMAHQPPAPQAQAAAPDAVASLDDDAPPPLW